MDHRLIASEELSRHRKSLIPGEGFFVLEDVREREREEAVREAITGHDVLVPADDDADGLAAAAVVRAVEGEAAVLPSSPHSFEETLERIAEEVSDDVAVYVCDLVPDEVGAVETALDALADVEVKTTWYDHHQWPPTVEEAVRDAGIELIVGDGEHECTADVAVRSLPDVPDYLATLAAVVRDHDLWIKEDPRSDDLADFAYWADAEEFINTVLEHGVDLPESARDLLAERREEKEALIDLAVDRARFVEVNEWTVGMTYGRCSQNEVAEALRAAGADAAVIVKPAGSASIRGSETFERCHEVARQVRGGGHPRAAGCKPPIYDDMLDYARHWVTEGAVAQQVILDAFDRLD